MLLPRPSLARTAAAAGIVAIVAGFIGGFYYFYFIAFLLCLCLIAFNILPVFFCIFLGPNY